MTDQIPTKITTPANQDLKCDKFEPITADKSICEMAGVMLALSFVASFELGKSLYKGKACEATAYLAVSLICGFASLQKISEIGDNLTNESKNMFPAIVTLINVIAIAAGIVNSEFNRVLQRNSGERPSSIVLNPRHELVEERSLS